MGRSRHEAYTALDGRYIGSEKGRSLEDFDAESDYSSRDVSGSYVGLLSNEPPPKAQSFGALSYAMRRRRFSRYFTCILATAIIAFILFLTRLKHVSESEIRSGIQSMLPNQPPPWEDFPFLTRYHGGIKSLVPRQSNKPEYPDPEREAEIGKKPDTETEVAGDPDAAEKAPLDRREAVIDTKPFDPFTDVADLPARKQCFLDADDHIAVPPLQLHMGVPKGMPDPVMGSYDIFGIQNQGCFDRYGRLGPYGLGYSKKYGGTGAGLEGDEVTQAMKGVWGDKMEIDYSKVNWADAQARCAQKNRNRYGETPTNRNHFFKSMGQGGPEQDSGKSTTKRQVEHRSTDVRNPKKDTTKDEAKLLPRSAVIIRTWQDYKYDAEDIMYLRAIVNELALQSGGEYTVHFLIHVKDDNLQIWSDDDTYQRTLDNALPQEFKGMGTLWSERQMGLIYGGVHDSMYRNLPVHGAYRSTYMPVQYFAHMHPEYDFFWHWEMDARYTGHFYHLFDRVSAWAKKQPRKGLWERNGRFYVPSEHGDWDEFSQYVRVQTEHGTGRASSPASAKTATNPNPGLEKPIWGALRPPHDQDHFEIEKDPEPPTPYAEDKGTWGVGEDADFITFNPLFDPDQTNWILAEDVTGYNTEGGYPARRTAIITASRLSRRLLETMHRETSLKRHTMFSEMWPGTCALHHGLKAVYAPHPVYIDRRWPTSYLAAIMNNGKNGASGGARLSVFSDERQHNFRGTTWYYNAGFPENLWKRWLGYRVNGDGGEEAERAGEGRMCLPSMLLHPVKHVDMIYEDGDSQ